MKHEAYLVLFSIRSASMEYSRALLSSSSSASRLNLQNFQPASSSRSNPCSCFVWPADVCSGLTPGLSLSPQHLSELVADCLSYTAV